MHVGIDVGGRRVAIAVLDDQGSLTVHAMEAKKSDPRSAQLDQIVAFTATTLGSLASVPTALKIFVEEPLVGRNVRASITVAEGWGAVLAGIGFVAPLPHYDVSVTAWKKEVVGKGNVDKDAVAMHLKQHYPSYYLLCDGNQDLIDATCIALYGRACTERLHAAG